MNVVRWMGNPPGGAHDIIKALREHGLPVPRAMLAYYTRRAEIRDPERALALGCALEVLGLDVEVSA